MESFQNVTLHGFILLGFSETPHLLFPLLSFFLSVYVLGITGNTFLLMLIVSEPQLHNPMFFLMGNLAFVDVSLASIIIPRALYSLLSGDTYITSHGCFVQLFLYITVGNMDCFLLAIMAFDRFSAVCFPLRYLMIMNRTTCFSLVAFSWVFTGLHSTLHTVWSSTLPYCSSVIQHFFCELPAITQLSCPGASDRMQKTGFIEGSIVIFAPVLLVLVSYVLIIRAVLNLKSSQGRWKAFSTCSSHLTMIILLYSTLIFMYFRPSSMYSPVYNRAFSIVYTIIIPMLNPFIYSFRNKTIKKAVQKLRGRF
ncbi:olfactory receptor 1L4-like [Gastrophryne carolinensis]